MEGSQIYESDEEMPQIGQHVGILLPSSYSMMKTFIFRYLDDICIYSLSKLIRKLIFAPMELWLKQTDTCKT